MTHEVGGKAATVVLVEDEGWKKLRPLTWLRPAADLVVGAWTIRERWERATGDRPALLCREEIAALSTADGGRSTAGAGDSRGGGSRDGPRLWIRDRFVPDPAWARDACGPRSAPIVWRRNQAVIAVLRNDPAAPSGSPLVATSAGSGAGSDPFWERLARGAAPAPSPPVGAFIDDLPDLLREGSAFLDRDLESILAEVPTAGLGDGAGYAPERIRVGERCRIDRGAVLDARPGPIVIGEGTTIAPFTSIRGPFLCRPECVLLGGSIGGGVCLGPGCRVRGEVESTTFLGNANKSHDGFIGHSYIAEWVNLGALTTTSDLKNNYGTVHLEIDGRRIETGQMKVGSFIGDHVKTRIGTLLNSGSVVGVGANLFGEVSLFPKWVPDFAWGTGTEGVEHAIDRCLKTAEIVMTRRGVPWTPAYAAAIRTAFHESREARQRTRRPDGER